MLHFLGEVDHEHAALCEPLVDIRVDRATEAFHIAVEVSDHREIDGRSLHLGDALISLHVRVDGVDG